MKTYRWLGSALLLSGSAVAHASEPVDLRSQLSVMYSTVFEDSDRGSERGHGAYLGYIHNFSEHWAVEPALNWHNFSADVDSLGTRRGWREWGGNIDLQYYFSRDARFSPYMAIGPGLMRLEEKTADTSSTRAYGSAGVGFLSQVTRHVGLRAEVRYRVADVASRHPVDTGSFGEPILRVGLTIPLGAAAAAPAAAPASTPSEPASPAPTPSESEPDAEVIFEFDENVLFEFDSAELQPAARESLDNAAELLRRDDTLVKVEVAGHADDTGAADYNKELSQRRAQSVRDYLVDSGVDAQLLSVKGYGEERPRQPNTTPENRQRNRRVELIVLERNR